MNNANMVGLMEWISVKHKKPKEMSVVYVMNSKGWMHGEKAIYHFKEDVFVLFESRSNSLVLDVTHWYPLPVWVPGLE